MQNLNCLRAPRNRPELLERPAPLCVQGNPYWWVPSKFLLKGEFNPPLMSPAPFSGHPRPCVGITVGHFPPTGMSALAPPLRSPLPPDDYSLLHYSWMQPGLCPSDLDGRHPPPWPRPSRTAPQALLGPWVVVPAPLSVSLRGLEPAVSQSSAWICPCPPLHLQPQLLWPQDPPSPKEALVASSPPENLPCTGRAPPLSPPACGGPRPHPHPTLCHRHQGWHWALPGYVQGKTEILNAKSLKNVIM